MYVVEPPISVPITTPRSILLWFMCFILFIEDKNSTYSVSDSRNKKKLALQVMLTPRACTLGGCYLPYSYCVSE